MNEYAPPAQIAKPLRVAIDDGLAQMKLHGEVEDGIYQSVKFPTGIKSAGAGAVVSLTGQQVGMYETEEGEKFVVTSNTKAEESRFPDFHVSQINRVMIRHALINAGYAGKKIELFTSLPVDEFFSGAARNVERIKQKVANLKKGVTAIGSDVIAPDLVDVKVGCQAVSAFFDYLYDHNGKLINEIPDGVAVIDIGGSTTDIAVIMDGEVIDFSASGCLRKGVLDVHVAVQVALAAEMNLPNLQLTPKIADEACRTGIIKIQGQSKDIKSIVDAAVHDVGSVIGREIDRKIGEGAMLSKILLVGGGAGMFHSFASRWPHAVILRDAEYANARGLLKFAKVQG